MKKSSTELFLKSGQNEDIRNYFFNRIDCQETLNEEAAICDVGGSIKGFDQNVTALMSDADVGKSFGGITVKLTCSKDAKSYLINGTIGRVSPIKDTNLFSIPKTCEFP